MFEAIWWVVVAYRTDCVEGKGWRRFLDDSRVDLWTRKG